MTTNDSLLPIPSYAWKRRPDGLSTAVHQNNSATVAQLLEAGLEPLFTLKDLQLYRLQLELRAAGAGHP